MRMSDSTSEPLHSEPFLLDIKATAGLSFSGARKVLQHLRYPPFAYSRALNQVYAWLIPSEERA